MNKKVANNIRLGIFITLGVLIFIAGIYFIGSRQNMFSSNTRVVTTFKNVGGLQEGNNVRFSGITVGSVESIEIVSNIHVRVTLLIEKDASKFIRKDAIAMIGGEGLMGDKVINLTAGTTHASIISEGDELKSTEPVNMEDLMASFQEAGHEVQTLVKNLTHITSRINKGEGTIGKLVSDDKLYSDFSQMMSSFNNSSKNAEIVTKDFAYLSNRAKNGQGNLGKLLVDESLYKGLEGMMDTLRVASKNAVVATDEMVAFSTQLNNDQGTVGRLLSDTLMASNINQTLTEITAAADGIETTTNKINNSWFLNLLLGNKKNQTKSEFK